MAVFAQHFPSDLYIKSLECFKVIQNTKNIWQPFFDESNKPIPQFFKSLNIVLGSKEYNGQFIQRFTACGLLLKNYEDLRDCLLQQMSTDRALKRHIENIIRKNHCNLSLESLLITPMQRVTRYALFANDWTLRFANLSDTDPEKIAVKSIYRKFKRMAVSMNGLEKAKHLEKEQNKNRTWTAAIFSYFYPRENIVDNELLGKTVSKSFEESLLLVEQSAESFIDENFLLAENALLFSQTVEEHDESNDEVELQALKTIDNQTKQQLINAAFKNLDRLTAQNNIPFPEEFYTKVNNLDISQCSESQFTDLLNLIQLAHNYLKNLDENSMADLIKQANKIEDSLITINPEKATALILSVICLVVVAAVLFSLAASSPISLAIAGCAAGLALIVTLYGLHEAKKTFAPVYQGFFAATREAKLLPEIVTGEGLSTDLDLGI